jgi:DME family drug/metabolite transporter
MIGELAALGAAVCWTVSAILYKEGLRSLKPVSANIVRLASTSVFLIGCIFVLGKIELLASLPLNIAVLATVSGILGLGLGDTLYMVSLKRIGVARAVPITCTYPLFTLLWTALLLNEPLKLQIILGALAIVFGIWLLSREKEASDSSRKKNLLKGVGAALATAAFWSVSITMMNMAVTLPETDSLDYAFVINALRVSSIAVFMLVFAPLIDRSTSFLRMNRKTLASIVSGGVVALALGWFFLAASFLYVPESQAVPISSTSPLFSAIAGIAFLREKVTAKIVAGSAVIVVGIFLIFMV